jgi:hypothetical protein
MSMMYRPRLCRQSCGRVQCSRPAPWHDSQAPSWMETGASQCIHDLLPGRRVELQRKSRVALKRWQMLYLRGGRARACRWPGVSAPSHIRVSVVALPLRSLFSLQEQTLASPPLNFLIHSLAIVSRLFHAEKGIQRVQSGGPC